MLLSELNLKALNVSAESVLPMEINLNIEGHVITFIITAFQSGFGSGKKTVISGSISRLDNKTEKVIEIENADVEKVRRVCASLCELTISGRKTRAVKNQPVKTEVEKLRDALSIARRLPKEWVTIDAAAVWEAYKQAKQVDAAPNEFLKLSTLDRDKQLKAYELLKNAGLI